MLYVGKRFVIDTPPFTCSPNWMAGMLCMTVALLCDGDEVSFNYPAMRPPLAPPGYILGTTTSET